MKSRNNLFLILGLSLGLLNSRAEGQVMSFLPSAEPVPNYPAGAPIPNAPNVPTSKNFVPVYEAWEKKVFIDTYKRSHPGDARVEAFLRDAARYLHGGNEQERAALNQRADELVQTGNDDPAVHFLSALVQKDIVKRESLYRRAAGGLKKSSYSPFLHFIAMANIAQCLSQRTGDKAGIATSDGFAVEALRVALNSESFVGDESMVLIWRLASPSSQGLFTRQGDQMIEIFQQATGLPPWIQEYALGRGYLGAAWKARGGGWSSEVTEAGWREWDANLPKAREHLTKAWELNPRDPAAAAAMIEVAEGDGSKKTEMRRWFDRSVAAQFDYFDAYSNLIWALRPRWYGSHEEMLLFGDEMLRTGRFDTCVPYYYFGVVADIASEESDASAIYGRPAIAANLKLALDTYLSLRESPLSVSYAHTISAILDFKAGNLAAAKSHLAAIQFKPVSNVDAGLKDDLTKLMRSISTPATGTTSGVTSSAP